MRIRISMRSSIKVSAVAFSLIAAPCACENEGRARHGQAERVIEGLCYGPFREGQCPGGLYPAEEQVRQDLELLASACTSIRLYGNDGMLGMIPEWCGEYKLNCWAGAWLGPDPQANRASIQRIVTHANAGWPWIRGVIVGNEAVSGGHLDVDELVRSVRQVREAVTNKNLAVATAEGWATFQSNADLAEAVDVLILNVHPFWGGVPVEQAAQSVVDTFLEAKRCYPSKQIVIGETGWPAAGTPCGAAIASEANQRLFLRALMLTAETNNVPYIFFEAFDESWKTEPGGVGPHWGLFYEDRTPKPAAVDVLGTRRRKYR